MNSRWLSLNAVSLLIVAGALCPVLQAQDEGPLPPPTRPLIVQRKRATQPRIVTLPAGTKIPLTLRHAITTKTAREGDAVYAETAFPVVVVIPAGSYVQGVIAQLRRAGRVKGRAELVVHFKTLIFPSGYTLQLSGAIDSVPGAENGRVKDKEGTIEGDSSKGKDAEKIATGAGYGGAIGTAVGAAKDRPLTGLAGGGAAGAAAGLAAVLLTRGPDIRFEPGSMMETALERPLDVDVNRVGRMVRMYQGNAEWEPPQ